MRVGPRLGRCPLSPDSAAAPPGEGPGPSREQPDRARPTCGLRQQHFLQRPQRRGRAPQPRHEAPDVGHGRRGCRRQSGQVPWMHRISPRARAARKSLGDRDDVFDRRQRRLDVAQLAPHVGIGGVARACRPQIVPRLNLHAGLCCQPFARKGRRRPRRLALDPAERLPGPLGVRGRPGPVQPPLEPRVGGGRVAAPGLRPQLRRQLQHLGVRHALQAPRARAPRGPEIGRGLRE